VEIEPSIQSVERGSPSPNTDVVVSGTTGSCSRVGTLTLEGTDVQESVSGEFKVRFRHVAGRLLGDLLTALLVTLAIRLAIRSLRQG
jgi:hypothetical protein